MTESRASLGSRREMGATRCGPFDIAWTEFGPVDAPAVLLLHGIYAGAHSYEWRKLVPVLEPSWCVRVPDLLGTGASDRPDLAYDRATVQRVVDALVADSRADSVVVASSLTGAYAVRSVAAGPVRPLVLVTPTGLGRQRERAAHRVENAAYALARHTPIGDAVITALTSAPSVRWFQTHKTYRDPTFLGHEELEETARVGRLPNAKQLQLAFVFGRLSLDLSPAEVGAVAPTVIWGCGQRFVDNRERERWRDAGADVFDFASGLPHVEEPDRVAETIRRGSSRLRFD